MGINLSQELEKIDESKIEMKEVIGKFLNIREKFISAGLRNITVNFYPSTNDFSNKKIYTIADYRREFNTKYCSNVDVLVWGESDSLLPKQLFEVLDSLHDRNIGQNIYKYFTFFGTCKMWDESWIPIEHNKFTDKPFIDNDYKNWWNHHYTMNLKEMNKINDEVEQLDVRMVNPYKFNGCGLIFSSDIIRSGANIPESVFFIHEDTAFMNQVQIMFGNSVPQFVIKNILLVHNRHHPKKRMYVLGEGDGSLKDRRRSNDWYNLAGKYSEFNAYNFNKQNRLYTWEDVWKNIK